MSLRFKRILAAFLLLFAGVTLGLQVRKEFQAVDSVRLPEGVNVICTHATVRCPTCLSIERHTREVLKESFKDSPEHSEMIAFHSVNYESPQFAELARRYKIATATVLLVKVVDSEIVSGVALTNETWKLHTDEAAFKSMLKERINAFLEERLLVSEDPTTEVILEPETLGESNSAYEATSVFLLSDEELDRKFGVENAATDAAPSNYVWVVYFYRLPECESCRIMSKAVFEILQERYAENVKNRRIVLRYRDFEDESNAVLVQKLKIESPSLAVFQMKGGKPVKVKLAGKIWSLAADQAELSDYIGEILREYGAEKQ